MSGSVTSAECNRSATLQHRALDDYQQGIDDALIQPYSGHASRQSLEISSRLAIGEAQEAYEAVIRRFPV